MPTPDLSSYKSVQSNLFVRIQVDEYRATTSGAYTTEVLRFSDDLQTRTINSESYAPLGRLMGITSATSELRVSSGELTITLSGIPNTSIAEIINSKIKGAPVRIYRLFSNAATGTVLSIAGNPSGRYRGFVNNYSLNEEYDSITRSSTNTIVLTCASSVDVLQNKIAGRKTNPESQKRFFPSDLSMDRVPTLENATFNFGAPK
jgi:hypothetical protein